MYDRINSPITMGGVILKNRIIFAPTSMGLGKKEYLDKIEKLAPQWQDS